MNLSGTGLLRQYVKDNKALYLLGILFMIAANIINSYYPTVLGQFTDDLHLHRITKSGIVKYSLQLLLIGVLYGILFGLGQYTVARLGRKFEYLARKRLFQQFSRLSERYFSRHGVGRLLSHVMNDVTAVRESIANGVNQTTNATIVLLSAIVMMIFNHIPFYLIIVCMAPLMLIPFFVVYFGPRIRNRSKKVQEALATMTESSEEQFGGIRVTKTFAVEPMARRRFGETVDDIRDRQLLLVRISSLFQALLPFMGALSLVITIVFGGYLTIHQQLTVGHFVALTLYLRMVVGPLQQIGNVINTMQRSRASLERINNLLQEVPDIQQRDQAQALRFEQADISFQHLSFAYPDSGRNTLHDIELNIASGKTLGIVGKTGSGKTTLVKLLLRVYDPPNRTVYISGKDIKDLTLESLRTQIAYVPQDGFLFSTTIQDNIAFYNRLENEQNVENASKEAHIHHSIQQFPQRYETKLGERGITLSGGQRQRTSLARGFIKKAPILILDDSVSAVDAVTETRIIDNIKTSRKGKTTIIIAHRLSAVKHADEIIVLDAGRIVQRGTHQQLLDQEGIYRSLYALQEEGTRHG